MDLKIITSEKPEDMNVILAQSHFIKTVEDVHELLVNSVSGIKFGLAFCEASGDCLIRYSGNDNNLIELAKKNALNISAGHFLIILIANAYPINFLPALKNIPEICHIFCATGNPLQVIIAETEQGRAILGVIDGYASKGVETEEDIAERKEILRKFGYKL